MVICELHRRNCADEPYLMQSKFMGKMARIRKRHFNEFFNQDSELQSMGFSSLKANRSLMTHLFYSIQENEGKEGSAFELIQKMRNHLSDITKTYIHFKEGEMGDISRAILAAGPFGYIWDALLDVIQGQDIQESKPLLERVDEIVELKKIFGEAMDVEQFFSFLQIVENDRVSIVTQIQKLEPEEAFEHMRKIYLGENPSMVEDIQCFAHPNCPTPSYGSDEEKGNLCLQCRNKIPNIYALTAIFNYLERNMNIYHHAITRGSKAKYYRNIAKAIDLLNEATNRFGGEFVWSFYEGGEDAMSEKLKLIGEVKND